MRRIWILGAVLAVGGLVVSAGIAEARAKFRISSPARAATPVKPAMAQQPSGYRGGTFVGLGIPFVRSAHATPANPTSEDTMSAAERLGAVPTAAAVTAPAVAVAPTDAELQTAASLMPSTPAATTPAAPQFVSLAYPPRVLATVGTSAAQPTRYCELRSNGRCAPF